MKTPLINRTTRRRIGAVAVGMGLLFGAAACGNNSQSEAEDLLAEYGIDEDFINDPEFRAELKASAELENWDRLGNE